MENLHPGAKWLFRFEGYVLGIFVAAFFSFIIGFVAAFFSFIIGLASRGSVAVMVVIWVVLVFLVGELFSRLYYKNWKYEFGSNELKIEKGIIIKKYKSIPYGRIQNVDVRRGIFARIFGFSTLNIQTAGYSGGYGGYGRGMSEGYIPAVSIKEADKRRTFLMKKISGRKSGM